MLHSAPKDFFQRDDGRMFRGWGKLRGFKFMVEKRRRLEFFRVVNDCKRLFKDAVVIQLRIVE